MGSRSREFAKEDGDLPSVTVILASRLAARPKVAKSLSLTPFAGSLPAKASSSRPLPAWQPSCHLLITSWGQPAVQPQAGVKLEGQLYRDLVAPNGSGFSCASGERQGKKHRRRREPGR